jgi:hypothetical protein
MKKIFLSAILILLAGSASAANVVVSGSIQSPTSTSVTCGPVSATLTYPVAANTLVCPIAVLPTSWAGAITLSDPTHFTTGDNGGALWLKTGPTSPPAGNFSVTITTAP